MIQSVDETIEQIERLYQSVTGKQVPAPVDTPFAAIPPEKDPEAHVGEQIDRLLASLSQVSARPVTTAGWAPPISVWQAPTELLMTVDLPGVARDTLRVRLANGLLEVAGTRPVPVPDGPRELRYAEPLFGTFRRMIPVPGDVAADQLQAQLKDGVLVVRIPRLTTPADVKDVTVG